MTEIKTTSGVKTPFEVIDALYEMISISFTNKKFDKTESQFKTITDKDKQRNFFMVNRRLAINYPLQAFKLSQININPIFAINCWYMITLREARKNKTYPKWLWLKTEKEKKQTIIKYSNEAKDYYIKLNMISETDFDLAIKYKPKEMKEYLDKIDKQIKKQK